MNFLFIHVGLLNVSRSLTYTLKSANNSPIEPLKAVIRILTATLYYVIRYLIVFSIQDLILDIKWHYRKSDP